MAPGILLVHLAVGEEVNMINAFSFRGFMWENQTCLPYQ